MTKSTAISDTPARAGIDIHQFYSLDIKGAPAAALADVYEFEGTRGIGEPTKYTIRFTHPRHDLSRSEFLKRMGAFVIQPPPRDRWSQPEAARRVQGVVTGFALKAVNRDQSLYEIVLESRLALLRNAPKCRFFLDLSIPEIIERILREHEFNKIFADFEFRLNRTYRKRSFVMQWGEDDLAFITRLCRRSGIWFVCDEGERCERVCFGDDYAHYRRDPERLTVAYRPHSGLEASGVESVRALEMRATTLPAAYVVRTFNTETAISDPIEAVSPIRDDRTTYGEAYTWGAPILSEDEAKEAAQLRREAALAGQVEYRGECDMLDLTPGSVLKLSNRELPDAKHGLVVVRVTCGASRRQAYHVTFDAIPSDRQYRMPLKEETWPRIDAVITGTIASSDGWKNPYLDSQGEYIVDLHLDRDTRTPGLQSCPMRLAKPFAGPNQTGFHFGLVEGTVVGVSFLWGCVDLPFISHVLHTAQHTDPIVAGVPWGTRNTIRTRSNNTLEMDDREGREHIKVATEHGKSQLNLGHTVDRGQSERGSGAELRSDGPAALRGGGGVLVSAHARNGASGKQLDMQETVAQLEDALALAKALASSARASKAEAADIDSQRAANKALDQLQQSSVLVTAPASAGVVAAKSVQIAAGENIMGIARGDASWSVWKRFTVAAHDMVSLFTQRGMSLIAAAGAVVVQAQRGRMQLASQDDMTVETVNGVLHVKSSKEIVLNVGGSYFRLTPGGIEIGTRGGVLFKTSSLKKTGPAQMDLGGAAFAPAFVPYTTQCDVWRTNPNFVPPASPASVTDASADTGAAAPSFLGGLFGGKSGAGSKTPGNGGLTVNDAENEKSICIPPDPIQLQSPAPCNWQLADFVESATMMRETPPYQKYGWTRTERLTEDGQPVMCAGTAPTTCQFTYDSVSKTLTAKVVIALVPRLLVKMNRATREPLLDAHNDYVVVQYETFQNGANSRKSLGAQGLMLVERDPKEVDASTYKSQIEKTLNQGNYKLILGGCQKGGACGCRVAVKFCADVHVVGVTDAHALNPNITINLYPTTERADALNWPETEYQLKNGRYMRLLTQTKAHETGHLFNFPDEYWEQGGFVHEIYVKDGMNIDFALADANKAKDTFWVVETATNLMGGGCLQPTATTSPYYLEYIRRWFSARTNKLWAVGYEVPQKNVRTNSEK
ncbi:type VI secretion system Vgr family protein [Burkholderia sp. Bp8998]|uniref:type VI secretion system Vgr family protein n=1 Tax=Burkholderia sp. Bp8998 TaxID=2184557 RepID=UPI000F595911|nr:type VI secretion system tip protein VgrG [Burkholderia sp. Bp8998]